MDDKNEKRNNTVSNKNILLYFYYLLRNFTLIVYIPLHVFFLHLTKQNSELFSQR